MLSFYLTLVDTPEEKNKFEKLYYKYRNLMYYCAREILQDDRLAEDAVQEAFLRLTKYVKKINDIECHKTKHLVVIIVECAAKDIYRKEMRHRDLSWEELEQTYHFPEQEKMRGITPVEEAILSLPLTYRQIFIMKYVGGYSNKEIGEILNVRQSTLRQRILRGKKILEQILKEMEVHVGE